MNEFLPDPIIEDIPLAQNAFDQSAKSLDPIDVSKYYPKIIEAIKYSIDHGYFVARIGPYSILDGEKIALELESKYGYRAYTYAIGLNELKETLIGVDVNWKFISQGTRERLN